MSPYTIGITGGIGSGKSFVCRLLEAHFDIPVYNCDIQAAIIMRSDYEVMEQLSSLVPGLYDKEDYELDKRRLADYMFSSPEHLQRVNEIVHPAVRKHLRLWKERSKREVVAVESAILYESRFDTEVDCVVFVDAPEEVRIQRTSARDGLTEEQVRQRIAHQHAEEARAKADYVLTNDGTANLLPSMENIIMKINNKIKKELC